MRILSLHYIYLNLIIIQIHRPFNEKISPRVASYLVPYPKKPSESLDNKKQAVILFVDRALARQKKQTAPG